MKNIINKNENNEQELDENYENNEQGSDED